MHRYRLLLTLLLLLTTGFCLAQGNISTSKTRSHYTYVYRLTDQEAGRLYRKGTQVVDKSFFHTPVDSFAFDAHLNKDLPQGHYLYLHSQGPDLHYSIHTWSGVYTKLLQVKPALAILVHDSLGQPLPGADVRVNTRKATYDATTHTYRLARTPRKGLLTVKVQGFTLYEQLEPDDQVHVYQPGLLRRIVNAFPIRYVYRPVSAVYQSVRWGEPMGWVRSVFSVFDAQYRVYGGYLVLNKPMCRPQDTLRYKGIVVRKSGKPVRGNVLLQLTGDGSEKINLNEVTPYRPGAFEGSIVLKDSLKLTLDKTYTLALHRASNPKAVYKSQMFRLEDYELKDNTFTLQLKQERHATGQENSLIVRGTNASGLNVLDARVEVVVTVTQIKKSTKELQLIPDTLWVHAQGLDVVGETTIALPPAIFPKASVEYTVTANFLDASNERTTHTQKATYDFTPGFLKLSLLQDSLLVQYFEKEKVKPFTATLTARNADFDDILIKEIQLPALVPLNAFAEAYEVKQGHLFASLDLEEEPALISLEAQQRNDSVYFSIRNPRRLPCWYFVYRGEKLVARGQTSDAAYVEGRRAAGDKPFFVLLQHLWAGEIQTLRAEAPHYRHLLSVHLKAPQVVYPGQHAQMTVQVNTFDGKPVKNVDLTAYAITSRFRNHGPPHLSTWDRYKRQKPVRLLMKEDRHNSGSKLMDWDYWGNRMGLDSIAFYRFLYPHNGIFTGYAPTRDSITQVSPFVVDKGRLVPVHVVYLDEVPVYFSKTDILPAYAFASDSGYHTLKLRTSDKLLTLDSVYLQHGQRLVLSADISSTGNRFTSSATKGKLATAEKQLLSNYLFQVEQPATENDAYLVQQKLVYPLTSNNSRYVKYRHIQQQLLLVGPLRPTWTHYVQIDNFTTNFMLEPGYSYRFSPHLLQMREWRPKTMPSFLPGWNKFTREYKQVYQELPTEQLLRQQWEAAERQRLLNKLYEQSNRKSPAPTTGTIGWSLSDSLQKQPQLVLLHPKNFPDSLQVYPRERNVLPSIKPGTYVLTLTFADGQFVSRELAVKPHTRTQVHFEPAAAMEAGAAHKKLLLGVDSLLQSLRQEEKFRALRQEQRQQAAKETFFSFSTGAGQYSNAVTGVVRDAQNGEALPGVNIFLKGTNIGTVTDIDGNYRLYVPTEGVLQVSFIGYVRQEAEIRNRNVIDVALMPDARSLEEVVVVGYGSASTRQLTSSMQKISYIQGKVAGVVAGAPGGDFLLKLRGISSMVADAKPLLIMDGIPFEGDASALKADEIAAWKTLSPDDATALYGEAGAAGVIIITTKKGSLRAMGAEQQQETANSIRNNFSDYAFWQPRLRTNSQGEASFTATFPDDISSWNTYVLALDNKKHSGLHQGSIRSFKAMMATLHLPRFLVEGDKTQVVGKASNYLPDSATVTTRFKVNGLDVKSARTLLHRSLTDTLLLNAPALSPDSVEVQFSLQQLNGYTDGERRFIPVYPKGILETTGHFLPLYSDTTLTLRFDPAKGPVTLHARSNVLEVLLEETEYLRHYEYWCNEQAASKLKGLLLQQRILAQLGKPFKHQALVRRLIRHLEKTQLENGAWAWWQQGTPYSWITAHVAEALLLARSENYSVKLQEQKLKDYLVYQLERGGNHDKLTALETLHHLKASVDFNRYVLELEKKRETTLEEQLRMIRLRQRLDLPAPLDTLRKHQRQNMLGGVYWGEPKPSLINNSISNTLLAYEILKAAGGNERELAQIRAYLLNERRSGHWRNTFESARILEALLPDLLASSAGAQAVTNPQVSFSGPLNFTSKGTTTDTTFTPAEPLHIRKQGRLPLYLTAYQTEWNRTPQPVQKDFIIKTSLKGATGDVRLQAGKPVELQVEVEVKADAEFVMIEIPIPASCSYEPATARGPHETHRAHYRHKVSIFCEKLPQGKYTYTISLQPRYSGTFTLNPARAELMYFPTFFGRNGLKQVVVQ